MNPVCVKTVTSPSSAPIDYTSTTGADVCVNQASTLSTSSLDDNILEKIRHISSQILRSRFVENFMLIWLDPILNEFDINTQNMVGHLQHIIGFIKIFTDSDKCVNFLTDITDVKVFMIISYDLGREVVHIFQNLVQIDSIYVFCSDQLEHEQSLKEFPKVKGVFIQIECLYDTVRNDVRQCSRNLTSISIVSPISDNNNFDKLDQSFMYSQLLKEILLDMPHDNDAKKELVEFCRAQYVGNDTQLKVIDEFEQKYDHPSSIWWYTRECFIYWMLNTALRTQDTGIVLKMGFFLRDLHHQIERLCMASTNRNHMTVFRGQGIPHSEFEKIKQSKGGLISFNNFLSTSMDRKVSFLYADSARQNRSLMGTLFQIEIDSSISSVPFVSLGCMGYFGASEKEVLFSMHTVFRIGDMKEIDNELWEVNLTLSGDNDKLLTPLTTYLRKEFQGESTLHRIGKLMIKMGQFDQAENIYDKLVHGTSNDDYHELGYLYHQLGLVKQEKKELKNAITYYETALEMRRKYLSSEHPDLAVTYSNMGSVYQSMEEHSSALQCHKEALQIRENCHPSDEALLAITYHNIGSTYQLMGELSKALSYYAMALQNPKRYFHLEWFLQKVTEYNNQGLQYQSMGEYSTALSYYERALMIRAKLSGGSHPLLTVTYSNIGSIYLSKKKFSEALSSYEAALEIQQHVFPPYHPSFAITYDNIGLVYLSMEKYSKSLSFYEKALEIQHKTLPPTHPDLANTYMKTAKVLENLQRYKEAVEYVTHAVEILRQVFSSEHHTVTENQEYLDFLRGKL